jgi:hypothetical protein
MNWFSSGTTLEASVYAVAGSSALVIGTGASGTERMRIDSAGNVGVGLTNPSDFGKLAVRGTIAPTSADGQTQGVFLADNTGKVIVGGYNNSATNFIAFNAGGGTERMRLDSAGNLGLGVTPSAWWGGMKSIDVGGVSSLAGGSNFLNLVSNGYLNSSLSYIYKTSSFATLYQQASSGQHQWFTAPSGTAGNAITFTQAMTLDANATLYTDGGTGKGRVTIQNASANNDILSTTTGFGAYNPLRLIASEVRFETGSSPSERMRIDSSGNLLVGTTTSAYKTTAYVSGQDGFCVQNSATGTGTGNGTLFGLDSSSNGIMWSFDAVNLVFGNTNTERMRIDTAGNVGIGTSSPTVKLDVAGSILASGNVTAYSDIRVKDNVESIEGAIGKLSQIRGVTYTRTDLDDKQRRFAGVIAQEIEQVLPEAVFDNGKVKAVDYNATIALLIEAVKEQQKRIDKLETLLNKGN